MTEQSSLYRPCVGIMLLNEAGKVWQGRRCAATDDPEGPGNWWQMPQGGIKEGEAIHQAAMRELHEETGVSSARIIGETRDWHFYDLPPALVPSSWDRPYVGQKQKWVAMRFLGDELEINIAPAAGLDHVAEFDVWRWVEMSELPASVVAFKRTIYQAVIAEFAHLA